MTAERLAILLMTFGVSPKRREYAYRTVASVCANLAADNLVGWYLADAGSPVEHLDELKRIIQVMGGTLLGSHNVWQSAGDNWNMGHDKCYEVAEVVLHLEDDFELQRTMDIRNYQAILEERGDVGIVRLGLLPIDLRGTTVGARGEIFLAIDRASPYAWSGNPCLVHRRWWDKVGKFPGGLTAQQTEVAYDGRLRGMQDAPAIWRPVDLGSYSPFGHIGEEKA